MAHVDVTLPAAAADGPGAWVDVSAMGADKLILVRGSDLVGTINIEISNEAVASQGAAVASLNNGGVARWTGAATWMRANVTGYRSGAAPVVTVGAVDDGSTRDNLPATAGDGSGASVDVSAMGQLKTVTVGGVFRGTVQVEFSQDNVTWGPGFLSFTAPGQNTMVVPAQFVRATRSGVPGVAPGLPVINIAGVNDAVTGGGSFANPQIVRYVAVGGEQDFFVVFAVPRANDDYSVFPGLAIDPTVGNIVGVTAPDDDVADRTVAQFRVVTTVALTAGDIIDFLVADR